MHVSPRRPIDRLGPQIHRIAIIGQHGSSGGIGLELNAALTQLYWTQVSLILLIIIATVIVSEWVSAKIRHAII